MQQIVIRRHAGGRPTCGAVAGRTGGRYATLHRLQARRHEVG